MSEPGNGHAGPQPPKIPHLRGVGPAMPLLAPMTVQPHPVPTQFVVGVASGPGVSLVVLQVTTPTGTQMYFSEPEAAIRFGEQVIAEARRAISGIILP